MIYNLDKSENFGEIKFDVDYTWTFSEVDSRFHQYFTSNPVSVISITETDLTYLDKNDFYDINMDIDENETLLDKEEFLNANDIKGYWLSKSYYNDEGEEQININFIFDLNSNGYVLGVYGDYKYKNEYNKLISDIANSVVSLDEKTNFANSSVITEENTIDTTTKIRETKPKAEKKSEKKLLFDNNGIKITYTEKKENDDGDQTITLLVENNTSKDWEFVLMNVTVNDFVVDPIFRVTVPSGKKAYEDIYFLSNTLEDNKINSIDEISFQVHYFDTVNPVGEKESYTTEYITFKP